jgi:hypothetical protein
MLCHFEQVVIKRVLCCRCCLLHFCRARVRVFRADITAAEELLIIGVSPLSSKMLGQRSNSCSADQKDL